MKRSDYTITNSGGGNGYTITNSGGGNGYTMTVVGIMVTQ